MGGSRKKNRDKFLNSGEQGTSEFKRYYLYLAVAERMNELPNIDEKEYGPWNWQFTFVKGKSALTPKWHKLHVTDVVKWLSGYYNRRRLNLDCKGEVACLYTPAAGQHLVDGLQVHIEAKRITFSAAIMNQGYKSRDPHTT